MRSTSAPPKDAGAEPRAPQVSPPSSPRPRTHSRTSSVRRKPVSYLEGDDEVERISSQGTGAGAAESWQLASTSGRRTQDSEPPSPAPSSMLHGFPPLLAHAQASATSSSSYSNGASPAAASSAAKHSLAPTPSTSSLQPPYANLSNAKASPAAGDDPFASRRSLRSQGSSVGGESVFGTPPVGVVGKMRPREVIQVERDYSSGEVCQLWSGWIWELEGRVSPTDYQNTLNELNEVLASAHDPTKSFIDNCLAVLTLYLSSLLVSSHYEREMRRLHSVLARANRDLYNPVGLNLTSPCENPFLFLEIEYY